MNVLPATVSVPVRLVPNTLDATMKLAEPLPLNGPPLMTTSQAVLLAIVHAHVASAVTVTRPEPPSAVNDAVLGEIDAAQPAGAPCVTVKVVPAINRVPVRGAVPVFAATLKVTAPGPDPLLPAVMAIHEALLLAAHGQSADVVTAVLPLPPAAAKARLVGDVLYEQLLPDCVAVYVFPAIVSVPVRVAAVRLVATMKATVPFPLPGPGLMTAIHATLLAASHSHAEGAVTVVLPNPPSATNHPVVDEIDGLQTLGEVCVTVKIVPAIVNVPVRTVVPVFGATVKATLPEADPDAPEMMVIHSALLLAVHAQFRPAVTVLIPVPPPPPNVWLVGDTLYEQLAPACVTVNVAPAMVSVPLRPIVEVLAATLNPTLPDPDPLAPLVTVIHGALLVALHAQPPNVDTRLVPVPPDAPNDCPVEGML